MQATIPAQTGTTILVRPKTLTIDEVLEAAKELPTPVRVEDGFLVLEKNLRGWKFKEPLKVSLENVLAVREKARISYIIRAFGSVRPGLIPWAFQNKSIV